MRFALLLLPALLWAQAQVVQDKDKERASLAGQVFNAVTSEPVRKVTLTLMMLGAAQSATPVSATSDANGKFAYQNPMAIWAIPSCWRRGIAKPAL